jgi:predicted RNA polymerase sigma factor
VAPSVRETDWNRVVAFYDLLVAQSPGPIVALNRALAVAERDGIEEGRRQLLAVAGDRKLARYPFYWAALADLQRRAARIAEARSSYERAIELSRSPAERASYRRRNVSKLRRAVSGSGRRRSSSWRSSQHDTGGLTRCARSSSPPSSPSTA